MEKMGRFVGRVKLSDRLANELSTIGYGSTRHHC
jgi:hypothetical protein